VFQDSYRHLKEYGTFIFRVRQLKESAQLLDPKVESTLLLPNVCTVFTIQHSIAPQKTCIVLQKHISCLRIHFVSIKWVMLLFMKTIQNTQIPNAKTPGFLGFQNFLTVNTTLLLYTLKPLSVIPICVTFLWLSFISSGPKNRPYLLRCVVPLSVVFPCQSFRFLVLTHNIPELLCLRKK
jgi:hypothetical protein